MTFRELLINLLGMASRWTVNFQLNSVEGTIYVQNGKIVKATVSGEEELSGKQALRFAAEHEDEIRSVKLLPLEEPVEGEVEIDQMEVFSIFTEVGEETNIEVERQSPYMDVCRKYFNIDNVKLIYSHNGVEYSKSDVGSMDELRDVIRSYVNGIKQFSETSRVRIKFSKLLAFIVILSDKFLFILLSGEEMSNLEIDEPEITENLLKVLQSD